MAALDHRNRIINPRAALMEQAIEQALARQHRVHQLMIFHSRCERLGLGPRIIIVMLENFAARRRVARMQIRLALTIR